MTKIFNIGQPKTGTKTIAEIGRKLNYYVNSNPLCIDNNYILVDNNIKYYPDLNNIDDIKYNIDIFNFFHDVPYSNNYEYINNNYPNSKFILTLRDSEKWFNSLLNYQKIPNSTNEKFLFKFYGHYKLTLENKDKIIEKYNMYNNNIINFFSDKPDKLIIINVVDNNINKNDELHKLGVFLNKKIDFNMPHENKQNYFN